MGKAARGKWQARVEEANGVLPPWTPFQLGKLPPITDAMVSGIQAQLGISEREAVTALMDLREADTIWVNSRYQVNVRRYPAHATLMFPAWPTMIALSIKRRDKHPLGREHFRDFQRIKNEIVGPEYEAVELYPAESRLVDSANQYWIWVPDDPTFRFPFGFTDRLVGELGPGPAKQAPFDE